MIHITSPCQESMTGSLSGRIWGGITNENFAGKPVGNTLVLIEKRFYIVLTGTCGCVTGVLLYEAALLELLVSGLHGGGRDRRAEERQKSCSRSTAFSTTMWPGHGHTHAVAQRTCRSCLCPPESYPRGTCLESKDRGFHCKGSPEFNEKARNSLEIHKEVSQFLNGEGSNWRSMWWNSSWKLKRPPLRWMKWRSRRQGTSWEEECLECRNEQLGLWGHLADCTEWQAHPSCTGCWDWAGTSQRQCLCDGHCGCGGQYRMCFQLRGWFQY